MIPSPACTELVDRFEGCVLKAYPDPGTNGDPWTIGVGHTGPEVHKGLIWTKDQARAALLDDLAKAAVVVNALIGRAKTTQGEFDALVSLCFNIGGSNLRTSALLRKHMAGEKAEAADQFGRWTRAAGRILPGLVKRRAAEAAIYRGN